MPYSIAWCITPTGLSCPARACASARRQNQRPLDLPQRDHDHPPRPAGRRRPGRLQIGMVAGFTSEQRPASGSVPPAGFVGIPSFEIGSETLDREALLESSPSDLLRTLPLACCIERLKVGLLPFGPGALVAWIVEVVVQIRAMLLGRSWLKRRKRLL